MKNASVASGSSSGGRRSWKLRSTRLGGLSGSVLTVMEFPPLENIGETESTYFAQDSNVLGMH